MVETRRKRGKGKRVARASEIVSLDEYGGGGACGECTSCRSLHRTTISFFKVMIGPDWDQFMLLPPKFQESVIDLVGRETVLNDAMGQKWTVTLSSSSDGLVFSKGWQAFVSDHGITMGDFLVFNDFRGSHFTVQIFGRTSCEKKCSGHRFKGTTQSKPCEPVNSDAMNIQILSISDESGSKFQPSAADGTQDSGGGNVKPPCLYNSSSLMVGQDRPSQGDLSSFEKHEKNQAADSKTDADAGVGNFNPATVMNSQAEGSKDFIGAGNLNSNIFRKETDVSMIEKEKILEFKDNGTPRCEKEHLVSIPSSLSLGSFGGEPGGEDAGNINKMVTKEQKETSGLALNRANRKRGLPSQYVDTIHKQAKVEPLDVPPSYIASVTCLAVTDGRHHLALPAKLPDGRFKKRGGESMAVVLKDQEGRLWPALYIQKSNLHVLISNWDKVNKKNGINAGDRYVFEVENSSEATYKIDVLRQ